MVEETPPISVQGLSIVPVKHKNRKTRGRPKLDEPLTISYLISAEIEPDSEKIEREKQKLGRFVLATNDLELSPEVILEYYKIKVQWNADSGFLKINRFGSPRFF